jgi:hypothetical protein
VAALAGRGFEYRAGHLVARLFFRGIYFPQMSRWAWARLAAENRRVIYGLVREAAAKWRKSRRKGPEEVPAAAPASWGGD